MRTPLFRQWDARFASLASGLASKSFLQRVFLCPPVRRRNLAHCASQIFALECWQGSRPRGGRRMVPPPVFAARAFWFWLLLPLGAGLRNRWQSVPAGLFKDKVLSETLSAPFTALDGALKPPRKTLVEIEKFLFLGVDIHALSRYSCKVVRKPLCWTGRPCSLTIDTMCQNPFKTIRLYSSPNG